MPTREAVLCLQALGLARGDVVLVRAAARALGTPREAGSPALLLVNAIRTVIGPEGTIVALSFSQQEPFWRRPLSTHTFDRHAPTTSGAVGQVLVDDPAAARSEHPTNSFVALGPLAEDIAGDHDETSTAFHPMRALIRHRGKMLLVGCMDTSPGFSTVHLAQEDLGLATRSVLSGLIGAHYYDHKRFGERRWFARADVPGCSMGFGKAYPQYEKAGLLAVGNVLAARSALIDAAAAYRIERAMLERDPTSLLCDEPACTFCATRTYNYRALPGYAVRVPKAIAKATVLLARRWAR